MKVRPICIEVDFPELQEFWVERGLPPVPREMLPPVGVAVDHEDALICGAFLVKSDAGLCSIGYVAANLRVDRSMRGEALDLMMCQLEKIAKESGYKYLTCATNVPALQARYEAHGYRVTDVGVKHYVKEV